MNSNFDYYGTITGFYIDGLPFPMPQNMKPKLVYTEYENRSLNNTLTVDRFEFEDKIEFNFDWVLTTDEFEQLKAYLNRDFVPCVIDMTKQSFDLMLRFKYDTYEIIGEMIKIQVNAKQK